VRVTLGAATLGMVTVAWTPYGNRAISPPGSPE
jgi:hypothetical protein